MRLQLYKNAGITIQKYGYNYTKCGYNYTKMRLCGGPTGTKLTFHLPRLRTRYPLI